MSFRMMPKLVTLNDLERRNGPYFRYFTEFVYDCRCKEIIRPTCVSQPTFA